MKKSIILFVVTLLILSPLFIATIYAAGPPPSPPTGGGGPGCWPPPCPIPLDGGISLLIAAGVAYGGKKIYVNHKKNAE